MQELKAIFDIGNGYIKAALFGKDDGKQLILAKEIVKTKGLRKGKVLDMDDLTLSMSNIIDGFHKKLGGDFLEQVFIGVSHPEMLVTRIQEQKRIMSEKITNDDIQHLSRIVSEISGHANYETLKIMPVYWLIDDTKREKDPLGLQAKKLELVADVFMIPRNFYNNLIDIFDKLNLNVVDIVPNILGAGEVALDFDMKDLGVALVDIGANHTSFVVYEEGNPLAYGTLPVGGEDVTRDISLGMQVDIKEAEEMKKTSGTLMIGNTMPTGDSPVDMSFLSEIIGARYEQIFELINEKFAAIDREGRLPGGIVLIGGGAKMKNLDIFAKGVFKLVTHYGKDRVMNLGELSLNPQFVNLIGVYTRSEKYYEGKRGLFKNLNFNFNLGASGTALNKVREWIKNVF